MPIDINSLRTTRGGNPDAVRKTQQARFKSVEIVDEVIALDDVLVVHKNDCVEMETARWKHWLDEEGKETSLHCCTNSNNVL